MTKLPLYLLGTALLIGAGHAQAPAPTLHEAMKAGIAPQAKVVWDIGNGAMGDDGNPDAKRLTPTDWSRMAAAGHKVKDLSLALAMAARVTVVGPGAKIQGEGDAHSSSASQVQAFIDADPAAFADHARRLAAVADDLVRAAGARDAKKLGEATTRLDEVCEGCHMQFWYPPKS